LIFINIIATYGLSFTFPSLFDYLNAIDAFHAINPEYFPSQSFFLASESIHVENIYDILAQFIEEKDINSVYSYIDTVSKISIPAFLDSENAEFQRFLSETSYIQQLQNLVKSAENLQFNSQQISVLQSEAAQFLKNYYESNILSKGLSLVDFLSRSPLAKDTTKAINDLEEFIYSNQIQQYSSITAERALKVLNSAADTLKSVDVDSLKSKAGEVILTDFDKILDDNPKLRLSASEFAVDFYENTLLPQAEDTAAFLARSPLAVGASQVATAPTSVIAAQILAAVGEKAAPASTLASTVSAKLLSDLAGVADSLGSGAGDLQQQLASAVVEVAAVPLLPVSSSLELPREVLAGPSPEALQRLQLLAEESQAAASAVLPALQRGGLRLGEELQGAGQLLVSNSASAALAAGGQLGGLLRGAAEELPQRSLELLQRGELAVEEQLGGLLQVQRAGLVAGLQELADRGSRVQQAVQQWSLFSDRDHWQTGFWETRLTAAARQLEAWQAGRQSLSLEELEAAAGQQLEAVGRRFVAISEAQNGRLQGIDVLITQLQGLQDSAQKLVVTAQSALKEAQASPSNQRLLQGLQVQAQRTVDRATLMLDQLRIALGSDGQVKNTIQSMDVELKELLADLSHYVEAFIFKGEDL